MNYYDVFGLSPTASPEDINAAHKALAKMYHPDINDSRDAHEKMAMLNEANEVLSDMVKRERYDNELRRSQQQILSQEPVPSQAANSNQPRDIRNREERAEKATLLRRKSEERLKTAEEARRRREEQAQRKTEESTQNFKQARAESDKQHVINVLSELVANDSLKRKKNEEVDEERYHATKVLLSIVRKDNLHLRRMAEEAERKRKIEEIISLVDEYNEKKEWV